MGKSAGRLTRLNKFTSLLDEPAYQRLECIPLPRGAGLLDRDYLPGIELTPAEWLAEAQYWRTKAARAHLAYSDAYFDYESALTLEDACLALADVVV